MTKWKKVSKEGDQVQPPRSLCNPRVHSPLTQSLKTHLLTLGTRHFLSVIVQVKVKKYEDKEVKVMEPEEYMEERDVIVNEPYTETVTEHVDVPKTTHETYTEQVVRIFLTSHQNVSVL